ncbi:MAG TPA: nuclear transport factor 2 family protein [Steroidobacteraceae bacterium]
MSYMQDTLRSIMEATQAQDNEHFLSFLADDVEYLFHVGSPGVRGKDGVRRFLAKYRTIAEDVLWRVDRTAESGDCLFIEGYEEYTDMRTGVRTAHPYMGIMEFRDGKIAKWRDYFEMNQKVAEK